MSDAEQATSAAETGERNLNLRIPIAFDERVDAASKAIGLKKADVYRLAIDHGVDIVVDLLKKTPAKLPEPSLNSSPSPAAKEGE